MRVRVAARGSRLSLLQVEQALEELSRYAGVSMHWEVVRVKSAGDVWSDRPLESIGVVGVFTREVDRAVASGAADIAVHSLKDMPTSGYGGPLKIVYIASRPSARDALISRQGPGRVEDLEPGSTLGTSSARRRALSLHYNPRIRVENLRGNLDTRLRKLREGLYDAIIASEAGLIRLGVDVEYTPLDPSYFPPAPGQGFVAVVARVGSNVEKMLRDLDKPPWWHVAWAERGVLEGARAGCRTPVAAYAEPLGRSMVRVTAAALSPDGSRAYWARAEGRIEEARRIGVSLGEELSRVVEGWHKTGGGS
ncbi:hydroxymethylbilane synthase [Aeropyrum pernix K1]|uniref:Probable porphobilinogen deaminase n=1 Tax=Aeropyrum pernix (strain ATCC 700893 / DSM 11879 / JCM 9820 / NBRC 100138 / K1) TaxID=272557 RepID=HEM3_AERPE|nr:RecName: Full=Probable porphobilinogen deaminase; Short=PBG; AltName: Full=Hydroxymethylbilane synthase; Short=HMBS; AltName: Full=Pre-uroporphyrinogen synthase [Aeropyrum pernix K1]BAA81310.2 hydroxymethylbilane synthase [Aeropyrum pernix K1]